VHNVVVVVIVIFEIYSSLREVTGC
jgi:hypothetical protein